MQDDENQFEQEEQPRPDRETEGSQPEPEPQPTSKEDDDSKSEQEPQPPSEREAEESQPEPQLQPTSENVVGEGQPQQRLQAPPAVPIPLPLTARQKRWQYFLSLVLGLIPVIVLLVTYGIGIAQGQNGLGTLVNGGLDAVFLYVIELIVMIVFLTNKQRRFVGYGLLTAFSHPCRNSYRLHRHSQPDSSIGTTFR